MDFELLSEREIVSIMSVLNQSLQDRVPIIEAHKIMVWFPGIANKILKSDTPANGFCVQSKLASKASEHQREFIEILWDRGITTIEIVRESGVCGFYGLPKLAVMNRDLTKVIMLPIGEDPEDASMCLCDFNC